MASDYAHLRHLLEALQRSPEVESAGAGAEVALSAFPLAAASARATGPARLRVLLFRGDPHAYEGGYSVGASWTAELEEVSPRLGWGDNPRYFREQYAVDRQVRSLAELGGCEVVCPPFWARYRELVGRVPGAPRMLVVPPAVPEWIYGPPEPFAARDLEVFFVGASDTFYPLRRLMVVTLQALAARGQIQAYLPAPYLLPTTAEQHAFRARRDPRAWDAHQRWYADQLRRARVMPFSPGIAGYPVQKFYEAMACGCLVLSPLPLDAARLGLVDGQTMVACDHRDWLDKLRYYLAHEDQRRAIADRALALVQRRYTCGAQARILVWKLRAILTGVPVEEVDEWDEPDPGGLLDDVATRM